MRGDPDLRTNTPPPSAETSAQKAERELKDVINTMLDMGDFENVKRMTEILEDFKVKHVRKSNPRRSRR